LKNEFVNTDCMNGIVKRNSEIITCSYEMYSLKIVNAIIMTNDDDIK
jgi:hypothetical protein